MAQPTLFLVAITYVPTYQGVWDLAKPSLRVAPLAWVNPWMNEWVERWHKEIGHGKVDSMPKHRDEPMG
jgi:hypothetical protein